jgi:hypothetical protein
MPFVAMKRRDEIKRLGLTACQDVGDPCFVFYDYLVAEWKKEPRWKTAHRLYRDIVLDDENELFWKTFETLQYKFYLLDIKAALNLAWQVFFQKYVMPYEDLKEKENGTI